MPEELRPHIRAEVDEWQILHLVCQRCRRKFFTLADAARHIYSVHGIKSAQRFFENI